MVQSFSDSHESHKKPCHPVALSKPWRFFDTKKQTLNTFFKLRVTTGSRNNNEFVLTQLIKNHIFNLAASGMFINQNNYKVLSNWIRASRDPVSIETIRSIFYFIYLVQYEQYYYFAATGWHVVLFVFLRDRYNQYFRC